MRTLVSISKSQWIFVDGGSARSTITSKGIRKGRSILYVASAFFLPASKTKVISGNAKK
jgi:hypothetical protein